MDTSAATAEVRVTTVSTRHDTTIDRLPATFRWGTATSAYQIEGAVDEDGRGPSIWDTFCRVPGAVDNGDLGDVACDHYHRMPQDVALIRELGLDAYRFSIAWPRIQPTGRGPANPAGLAFYDRLVDELLASDIEPWVTLYHWDLPQELEDAGGWPNRDTAYRFADYAELVYAKLGDRVKHWTTLNEPWCTAMLGYVEGVQAPGKRDLEAGMHTVHHLLLGHGLAVQRLRAANSSTTNGNSTGTGTGAGPTAAAAHPLSLAITLNLSTARPATDSPADREAARRSDGLGTRIYLDPLWYGRYPQDIVTDLAARGIELPIRDGDLELISQPLDTLGINYYFSMKNSGVDENGAALPATGSPTGRGVPYGLPRTAMGWEIMPDDFTEVLTRVGRDYPGVPIFVTENGAAFADQPDETGFVHDQGRIDYLASHIAAVANARDAGTDIRGYFVWSLLDNFEWAYGYDKRFGIVRVDYETQQRIPKRSAHWYRDTIQRVRRNPDA